MLEIVGWLSAIAFTLSGLPQAFKVWKEGHANGFSLGFLFCWFLGNLFGLIYSLLLTSKPLILGYFVSLVFGVVIWRFKLFPKK